MKKSKKRKRRGRDGTNKNKNKNNYKKKDADGPPQTAQEPKLQKQEESLVKGYLENLTG